MVRVERKIVINCPLEKVFQFVTNPENWTKYVTSLVDVRDLSNQDVSPGTTFKWTYRMLGMNFHGRGEVTENVKNKKFGMKMEGNFPIKETYTFSKAENGTELNVEIEYDMPGKIMSIVANKSIMEKINKKEAENVLTKIKILCEAL